MPIPTTGVRLYEIKGIAALADHPGHPLRPDDALELQHVEPGEDGADGAAAGVEAHVLLALGEEAADDLAVEDGVVGQAVQDNAARARDHVAPEVVGALRVQQDLVAARQEVRPRPRRLAHVGVLGDGAEREALHGVRRREVVAHAHEVEVRGDEDERAGAGVRRAGAGAIAARELDERGDDGAREVREARVRLVGEGRRLEARERLLRLDGAELLDGAAVLGLHARAARPVLAAPVQLRELRRVEGREHDRLPEVLGLLLEIPRADAAEVAAVRLARLQVEVLEDVLDVLPVLVEQGVGVVDDDNLDRAEEVVVHLLPVLVGPDRHAQAQRAGEEDVAVVELREELDGLARELDADPEHIVVVALEEVPEVGRLVRRELSLPVDVRLVEALAVLLLVGLAYGADGPHHLRGGLARGQNHEDLGPGEPLVPGLEVGCFTFLCELRIVLDDSVSGPPHD